MHMMAQNALIDVTATDVSHWKYISEGGATIVFSYAGDPNPALDGMVLRLRKISRQQSATEGETDEEEPDDPSISFQRSCMERLIPIAHLPRLESVKVSRSWLETMSLLHDKDRPEGRRNQGGIDTTRKKGVIATDLVGGQLVAVEIKVSIFPSDERLG